MVYYKNITFYLITFYYRVCADKAYRFIMETYRRGHNGTDSKSVYRYYTGTRVRIPPSPFFYYTFQKLDILSSIMLVAKQEAGILRSAKELSDTGTSPLFPAN